MQNALQDTEVKKLIRWGIWTLMVLAIFLAASALNAFKAWNAPAYGYNTISVSGEGEATAVPDIATFTFAVSADAGAPAEAQAAVTAKMNAILQALEDLGIEETDIKTSNYNLWPKYRYEQGVCGPNYCPPSRQILEGYTVSHDVMVKVRETAKAGEALAAVGNKGATNVSGLSFTIDEESELLAEARGEAIKDAREKARRLARDLGVRLGDVVSYYDNNPGYPRPLTYDAKLVSENAVGGSAPTLPAGENELKVSVTVVYEIR